MCMVYKAILLFLCMLMATVKDAKKGKPRMRAASLKTGDF